MNTSLIVLLVISAVVVGTWADIGGSAEFQGRADPIIAGQRNKMCIGRNKDEGTCQSRASCRRNKGTASGQCGIASGVCCTLQLNSNEATKLKRVVMTRPVDNSVMDFSYRFSPVNERVCQMRIDFRVLDLAQPTVTPATDGSAGSTTECSSEFLVVAGMKLCGTSHNQHVYVPLDSQQNSMATLLIHLSNPTSSANWNILATQLECAPGTGSRLSRANSVGRADEEEEVEPDSIRTRSTVVNDAPWIAPPGCLQYYPNSTGTVSTFNFDSPMESQRQYLPNLNYAICFNRLSGEKMNLDFEFFQMSDRNGQATPTSDEMTPGQMNDVTAATPDSVDSLCAWMGIQPTTVVLQDYLMIPQATYSQSPNSMATFFCGQVLNNVAISDYNEMGPVVMRFFSDNFIDTTLNVEKGFRFTYRLAA